MKIDEVKDHWLYFDENRIDGNQYTIIVIKVAFFSKLYRVSCEYFVRDSYDVRYNAIFKITFNNNQSKTIFWLDIQRELKFKMSISII